MKKNYETPSIEKIAFQYKDQVVVASIITGACTEHYQGAEDNRCEHVQWTGDNTGN